MNNNSGVKGWMPCLIWLCILGVIIWMLIEFWWVVFIVLPLIGFIRGWIWRRRIKKAIKHNMNQTNDEDSYNYADDSKYCEAEFEIVDDETDE